MQRRMPGASWFTPQTDVQRSRRAAPHVDLRDVGAIAALADLDGVRAFRYVDNESLLTARRPPDFAVDRDLRIGRLHANRQRAVRLRLSSARRCWRRRRHRTPARGSTRRLRRRIPWWLLRRRRTFRCRRRRVLRTGRRVRRRWPRLGLLAGGKLLECVFDFDRLVDAEPELL